MTKVKEDLCHKSANTNSANTNKNNSECRVMTTMENLLQRLFPTDVEILLKANTVQSAKLLQ